MKIKIKKESSDIKIPNRAHYNDAGADLFAKDDFTIYSNETKSIGLGLHIEIPDGMMGLVMPKSGLSSKGITSELSPIDSGYRGEIHAILHNQSDSPFTFSKGDKVAQLVIIPIVLCDFVETLDNDRGDGAFGSTGK